MGKTPRIIAARRGTLLRMPNAHEGIMPFHLADINHVQRLVSTAPSGVISWGFAFLLCALSAFAVKLSPN